MGRIMPARGRKKGGGYKNQLLILTVLDNGAKSAREIQQLTELSKNTIWLNLKILTGIKAVTIKREGRRIIYQLNERPFFKWLIFHVFMGHKWALKEAKGLGKSFKIFSRATRPIADMFKLVNDFRNEYEKRRKLLPELEIKDVYEAAWTIEQMKFVERARKYKDISAPVQLGGNYSRDRFLKMQESFVKVCQAINSISQSPTGYLAFEFKNYEIKIYYEICETLFPEIKDFIEKHKIKGYGHIPFKLVDKFNKLIKNIKACKLDERSEKLKLDIHVISQFAAKILSEGYY